MIGGFRNLFEDSSIINVHHNGYVGGRNYQIQPYWYELNNNPLNQGQVLSIIDASDEAIPFRFLHEWTSGKKFADIVWNQVVDRRLDMSIGDNDDIEVYYSK